MQKANKKAWLSSNDWLGYLFCIPLILGLVVFYYFPMVYALWLSFRNTNGITAGTFVGLMNYQKVLTDDVFWHTVYNTFYMGILTVLFNVTVPFVFSTMINSVTRGRNLFKSIFFIPNVVSVVATSLLFSFLMYPDHRGVLNMFLSFFGIEPLRWFSHTSTSRLSIALMGLWNGMGYNIIIFSAGLQTVSRELYEASDVDGATWLQKWWRITIPSVRPILAFVVIMETIKSMRRFSDVFMIGGTGGNPGGSIATVVVYIYRNAFAGSQMGVGSAAAFVLFIIILILTIINNKVVNRDVT